MNVGLIGNGQHAELRARAVQHLHGAVLQGWWPERLDLFAAEAGGAFSSEAFQSFLARLDAVFVQVPTAAHFRAARAATEQGVHVFLEWPPASSVRECEAIVRLAEEAGVEVGVSRPLRFHPLFEAAPEGWQADLVVLRQAFSGAGVPAWSEVLADALDLCCVFARAGSVQRIDAKAVRGDAAWPEAVAFGLRFHSGTYAQVSLRRSLAAGPCGGTVLYAAGPGLGLEAAVEKGAVWVRRSGEAPEQPEDIPAGEAGIAPLLQREARAFLEAVMTGEAAPVSILDGLHLMRLVERLRQKLR